MHLYKEVTLGYLFMKFGAFSTTGTWRIRTPCRKKHVVKNRTFTFLASTREIYV